MDIIANNNGSKNPVNEQDQREAYSYLNMSVMVSMRKSNQLLRQEKMGDH
jgi:hypothetical protein